LPALHGQRGPADRAILFHLGPEVLRGLSPPAGFNLPPVAVLQEHRQCPGHFAEECAARVHGSRPRILDPAFVLDHVHDPRFDRSGPWSHQDRRMQHIVAGMVIDEDMLEGRADDVTIALVALGQTGPEAELVLGEPARGVGAQGLELGVEQGFAPKEADKSRPPHRVAPPACRHRVDALLEPCEVHEVGLGMMPDQPRAVGTLIVTVVRDLDLDAGLDHFREWPHAATSPLPFRLSILIPQPFWLVWVGGSSCFCIITIFLSISWRYW